MRKFRVLAALIAVLVISGLTYSLPVAGADAVEFPVGVSDVNQDNITTLPNGSFVSGCGGGSESFDAKVFDQSGNLLSGVARSSGNILNYTCNHSTPQAAKADGTLFAERFTSSYSPLGIMAVRNGVDLWPQVLNVQSYCGGGGKIANSRYVPQRGLFLLVYGYWGDACVSGSNKLLRVNAETGIVEQTYLIPSAAGTLYMFPYDTGLMIAGSKISYLDYSSGAITTIDKEYEAGLRPDEPAVGADSTRFVLQTAPNGDTACGASRPIRKLSAFSPTGKKWDFALSGCLSSGWLTPTPNGGVVVMYRKTTTADEWYELQAVTANGSAAWPTPFRLSSKTATGANYQSDSPQVVADNNGTVVVRRQYWRPSTGGSTYPTGALQFVDLYAGKLTAEWLGETLIQNEYQSFGLNRVGLANDRLYMLSGDKIYALSVPNLGMEYPAARLYGQVSNYQPQLTYAALGDSYSSGEGVPPFEVGTDTAGPPENRCHRSTAAYPYLLANNPTLVVELTTVRSLFRRYNGKCLGRSVQ